MTGAEAPDRYTDLLALMAHEYFHAWNVKRLKPATFLPYDLTKENYTRLLWFFEGFTEYYEEIILFRAGLASEKKILDRLSAMALTVYGQSGWKHQSVAASSFDTWIKYYRPDAGSASHGVSYYQAAPCSPSRSIFISETSRRTGSRLTTSCGKSGTSGLMNALDCQRTRSSFRMPSVKSWIARQSPSHNGFGALRESPVKLRIGTAFFPCRGLK